MEFYNFVSLFQGNEKHSKKKKKRHESASIYYPSKKQKTGKRRHSSEDSKNEDKEKSRPTIFVENQKDAEERSGAVTGLENQVEERCEASSSKRRKISSNENCELEGAKEQSNIELGHRNGDVTSIEYVSCSTSTLKEKKKKPLRTEEELLTGSEETVASKQIFCSEMEKVSVPSLEVCSTSTPKKKKKKSRSESESTQELFSGSEEISQTVCAQEQNHLKLSTSTLNKKKKKSRNESESTQELFSGSEERSQQTVCAQVQNHSKLEPRNDVTSTENEASSTSITKKKKKKSRTESESTQEIFSGSEEISQTVCAQEQNHSKPSTSTPKKKKKKSRSESESTQELFSGSEEMNRETVCAQEQNHSKLESRNDVASTENEVSDTSITKKKKKKRSGIENSLQELSVGSENIVTTKTSRSDIPVNNSQPGLNTKLKVEGEQKKLEKELSLIFSPNSSEVEAAVHNQSGSSGSDPYTVNVFESFSQLSSKKKKKNSKADTSCVSTDYSILNQSCNLSDEEEMKRRISEYLEEHDLSLSSLPNENENDKLEIKSKKSKKEHDLSLSSLPTENENDKLEIKRKKSEKAHDLSLSSLPTKNENDKPEVKRKKSEKEDKVNETDGNKNTQKNGVMKNTLQKNAVSCLSEKTDRKGKCKESTNKMNPSTSHKKVKKNVTKLETEKKKKTGVIALKKLLSYYEVKEEVKKESKQRNHTVLLDAMETEKERPVGKKYKPFESKDLSFKELLENVHDKSRLDDGDIEKLVNLEVLLPWAVPPLHLIETRVAGRPNEEHRSAIDALGIKVKTGNFSKDEDEKIVNNWKHFCGLHDLSEDPTPFLNFSTPDKKMIIPYLARVNFVRFLAHGLGNRLLCSVYNRFKRLFLEEKVNSGRFTPEEDNVIVKFLTGTKSNTPYADLGKILNRSKLSVEKRCKTLVHNIKYLDHPIKWNKALIEEFIKHLVDITKVGDVEDLRNRNITPEEWKELTERLNIPAEKLQRAWFHKLYSQIFVKERLNLKDIKTRLILTLIERGEKDWRTVDWNEIAQDFEGFRGRRLNRMAKYIVRYHVPSHLSKDLKASLEFLKDNSLKLGKIKGHKIKRLRIIDKRQSDEGTPEK